MHLEISQQVGSEVVILVLPNCLEFCKLKRNICNLRKYRIHCDTFYVQETGLLTHTKEQGDQQGNWLPVIALYVK